MEGEDLYGDENIEIISLLGDNILIDILLYHQILITNILQMYVNQKGGYIFFIKLKLI